MKKKILLTSIVALSLALLVAVGGTMAWLFDSTDDVINSFSPTNIDVSLTETPYIGDSSKKVEGQDNNYPMLPGASYVKDPTVTVSNDSVDCFVFVKVVEGNNASTYLTYVIKTEGWNRLDSASSGDVTVYYRKVKSTDSVRSWEMLAGNSITVKDSVTKENMSEASKATLTFTAYACQLYQANSTEFSPEAAWAIASATPTP